jgi:hypothetical protein
MSGDRSTWRASVAMEMARTGATFHQACGKVGARGGRARGRARALAAERRPGTGGRRARAVPTPGEVYEAMEKRGLA